MSVLQQPLGGEVVLKLLCSGKAKNVAGAEAKDVGGLGGRQGAGLKQHHQPCRDQLLHKKKAILTLRRPLTSGAL